MSFHQHQQRDHLQQQQDHPEDMRHNHHVQHENSQADILEHNPYHGGDQHHHNQHMNQHNLHHRQSHHHQQQQQQQQQQQHYSNSNPNINPNQHHNDRDSTYQQHHNHQSHTRRFSDHMSRIPQNSSDQEFYSLQSQAGHSYGHAQRHRPQEHQQYPPSIQESSLIQRFPKRPPRQRPLNKMSTSLIETYKQINRSYYEERESKRASMKQPIRIQKQQGVNNNGWDDEYHDYIFTKGEVINNRYTVKERIGKGSFGQVFQAFDTVADHDVAIKIIKSKKPFLLQAKTEISLLSSLADDADQHNIVRLLTHFMYRNHQCIVFEMLSLNLYELLKNTQFNGVSLNLIRKFAKQILKALSFLSRSTVEIIHCDLKPENILLRHPKRSSVKIIDFGSSCKSNKRMYSYIQSRFYRSPEVILGLPYTVAIDMWSLGCILVEMHTGEPLFSGSDQVDQMRKIVKILGMIPTKMIDSASDQHRLQFFEKNGSAWILKQSSSSDMHRSHNVDHFDSKASIAEVIGAETSRKMKYPLNEPGHTSRKYELFVDFINRMLCHDPAERITPDAALRHPFISEVDNSSNRRRHHHHTSSSSSNHIRNTRPMSRMSDHGPDHIENNAPRQYSSGHSNERTPRNSDDVRIRRKSNDGNHSSKPL